MDPQHAHRSAGTTRSAWPGAPAAAHVARLAAELHRMSSHRDDATAIAALDLFEQMQAPGAAAAAQQFEPIYRGVIRVQRQLVATPAREEWKVVRRLAAEAFKALVWEWRDRVRSAAHAMEGFPGSPSASTGVGT